MPNDRDFDYECETTAVINAADLDRSLVAGSRRAHVLVRLDGPEVGRIRTLKLSEYRVGRLPDSGLHILDDGISRRHARLAYDGSSYVLEDLGSANGTFVRGERVQRTVLQDGDVIQFGPRATFRYSITDGHEEQMLRHLYEASVRDALTGAYNREYLAERLRGEIAYALRHGTETSLLLLDLDHFKGINDQYGHQAGDAVLVELTRRLTRSLRTEDVFARYGGEEFAISLRGIDLDGARYAAERLRAAVSSGPVPFQDLRIDCTISVGCASLRCCVEPKPEALIATADRRLYAAKGAGRNRVVAAD